MWIYIVYCIYLRTAKALAGMKPPLERACSALRTTCASRYIFSSLSPNFSCAGEPNNNRVAWWRIIPIRKLASVKGISTQLRTARSRVDKMGVYVKHWVCCLSYILDINGCILLFLPRIMSSYPMLANSFGVKVNEMRGRRLTNQEQILLSLSSYRPPSSSYCFGAKAPHCTSFPSGMDRATLSSPSFVNGLSRM